MSFFDQHKYKFILGFWFLLGLIYGTQNYLFYMVEGLNCSIHRTLFNQVPNFILWGIYTPFILSLRNKFPLHKEQKFFNIFAIHIPVMIGIAVIHLLLLGTIIYYLGLHNNDSYLLHLNSFFASWFYFQIILYSLVILFGYLLEYYHKYRTKEDTALYLEKLLIDSELRVLKDQLQPHFLFNTLNSISMLIRKNENDTAIKIIANLSELLREILDKRYDQWTKLKDEVNFVQKYLEIMTIRFYDKLVYKIEVDPEVKNVYIPDLILQPIIENSVKHGLSDKMDSGEILVIAKKENSKLVISITDNGIGFDVQKNTSGVGLKNITERLDKLYSQNYNFEIKSSLNKGTKVIYSLPLYSDEDINNEE